MLLTSVAVLTGLVETFFAKFVSSPRSILCKASGVG